MNLQLRDFQFVWKNDFRPCEDTNTNELVRDRIYVSSRNCSVKILSINEGQYLSLFFHFLILCSPFIHECNFLQFQSEIKNEETMRYFPLDSV